MKKRVVVVGFMEFNEKMYPHLYDFLRLMEKSCDVTYFGGDDRCNNLMLLSESLKSLNPFSAMKSLTDFVKKNAQLKKKIRTLMEREPDVAIAIDHSALNHVARYAIGKTRLIFWSLDYISDDFVWHRYYLIRRLLKKNVRLISKYESIIVQDKNRGAVLDSILGSHSIKKYYLPVSLSSDDFSAEVAHGKAGKKTIVKIALMQITAACIRGSDLLLSEYQTLTNDISLIFHGVVAPEIHELIRTSAKKPAINMVSDDFVSMRKKIAQADIGFVCYMTKDLNHHFISNACGQAVEFLKMGMPLIVFESSEIGAFIEQNHSGICISSIKDLSSAARTIAENYGEYSKAARHAYERHFNLDSTIERLSDIFDIS